MKPTAVLVNTRAVRAVDEAKPLADAIREKRIGGAAIDVFAVEPLPADAPLRNSSASFSRRTSRLSDR